tara:strand:+ start:3114 stop:4886 length:1773 start_codon:yes stop_codon:yes gene_type:complete
MEFFLKEEMQNNIITNYKFSFFFLNDLLKFLPKERKKNYYILLVLFLISSLLEAINVSFIFPVVSIYEDYSNLDNYKFIKKIIYNFNIIEKNEILKILAFSFILLSIFCGIIKFLSYRLLFTFSSKVESDVREIVFSNNLYQSYQYHVNQNSADVLTIISQKTHFIFNMLTAFLGVLSSFLLLLSILIALMVLEPIITSILFVFISLIFIIAYFVNKKKMSLFAKNISSKQYSITYIMQEAFGLITEILLYSLQNLFIDRFKNSSRVLAESLAKTRIISESPRIFLEYILIISFVFILYLFTIYSNDQKIDIALLSLLGFAALKLLPLVGKIYNNYSTIKSLQNVFIDVINILKKSALNLNKDKQNCKEIFYKNKIEFKNINFTYNNEFKRQKILNNFNYKINKNTFIGIKGSTGKGKSTLVKILMCLIEPDQGHIEVDGVKLNSKNVESWQKKISILPQKVFLNDTTILGNIVLGENIEKINFERVQKSAKIAEIYDFINSLPQKFYEKVGEAGSKLSGGQIKRIGLARTLYRNSEVIILDEPTNELDEETELKIIKSLKSLKEKKTIIIISHNPEIISLCDQIIDFDN